MGQQSNQREILKYFEQNEIWKHYLSILWDVLKVVVRGKFTALKTYDRKKRYKINI